MALTSETRLLVLNWIPPGDHACRRISGEMENIKLQSDGNRFRLAICETCNMS